MADQGAGTSASAAAGGAASSPRAPLVDPSLVETLLDIDVPPQTAMNITPQALDAYASTLAAEISRAPAADETLLLDDLLNTDIPLTVLSPEEMKIEAVENQEPLNNQPRPPPRETGEFVEEVLDTLVEANNWLDVVDYLGKFVSYHAEDSVRPVPAGTPLENVHAQLFLKPHSVYVYQLVAGGNTGAAQDHYAKYLAPLMATCENDHVRSLFTKVELTIATLNNPPNPVEAARQAALEIKDYIYLYFPSLKPKLQPFSTRGKSEPSQVWMFGQLVRRGRTEETGFRCFSCHEVFWNYGVTHLRNHLEGKSGTPHCPAVEKCTLDRLAKIPRRE